MPPPSNEIRSLRDVSVMGLSWRPTSANKIEFELRVEAGDLIAKFWKVGGRCPSAVAETSDGRWQMKRTESFIGHKITIYPDGSEIASAEFKFSGLFGKGKLKFADGREFVWKRRTVGGDKWAFVDAKGNMLVDFQQKGKMLWTDETAVGIAKEAVPMAEVSMLVLLGWYLILILAMNEHMNLGF